MTFNFDQLTDRRGSNSLKFDARQAYFGREDVLPMWVADMDFDAPTAVAQALQARAAHPIYGYSMFPDSLYQSLIDWCLKRYQWSITKPAIVMCPGVVPSICAAITALTQPNDKVIVQPPVYFPFFSSVTKTGRELVLNPLRLEAGRYTMDLEHLELCARDGARVLVLCSPHNPVGRVWRQKELEALLALAEKYQMTIISDEIHADLIYPDEQHIPLASLTDSVNVITAVSPSKTFNIPGLGLSSLVVPNKVDRQAIKNVFESWHISPNNPFSIEAYETAYREGEPWLEALKQYLQVSLNKARSIIDNKLAPIQLIQPEGTYLLWLDCRDMNLDDKALADFFIHRAGIGLSAGSVFGEAGQGFMRMNIGTSWQRVEQALNQLAEALLNRDD